MSNSKYFKVCDVLIIGLLFAFTSSCDDNFDEFPIVTTIEATEVTSSSAKSGGRIISDGQLNITSKGVCWNTSPNPSLDNFFTNNGNGTESFACNLTGLQANTMHYYRAYYTNVADTFFGKEFSFITLDAGVFTDSRDSVEYQYITIGNQVWMAENLKYLPNVVGSDIGSETLPYYYVYGYDGTSVSSAKEAENYSTYGVLYNWQAAMAEQVNSTTNPSEVQGICPSGWHLPSVDEWAELEGYLGGHEVAGGKMKEIGLVHWKSPNFGATNESEFTGLPGGLRFSDGRFSGINSYGYWWSSTEYNTYNASYRKLYYTFSDVYITFGSKSWGYSVRCVRD